MLKTLADKYSIDTGTETWEIELFNKCCTLLTVEQDALIQRDQDKKIRAELIADLVAERAEVARLKLYEEFVVTVCTDISDYMLATKLKTKFEKFLANKKEEQNTRAD